MLNGQIASAFHKWVDKISADTADNLQRELKIINPNLVGSILPDTFLSLGVYRNPDEKLL